MTTDTIKLNKSAHQKSLTSNPSIIQSVNRIITALMTSKNRPKVRTVTGIVNRIKTGRRITFKIDRTNITNNATPKLLIKIPGNRNAAPRMIAAEIKSLNIYFISGSF